MGCIMGKIVAFKNNEITCMRNFQDMNPYTKDNTITKHDNFNEENIDKEDLEFLLEFYQDYDYDNKNKTNKHSPNMGNILGIVASIIAILTAAVTFTIYITSLQNSINNLKNDINRNYEEFSKDIRYRLGGLDLNIDSLWTAIDQLGESTGIDVVSRPVTIIYPDEDFKYNVSRRMDSYENAVSVSNEIVLASPNLVIGNEIINGEIGNITTVGQNENVPIITSFTDQNGEQVFFYGKYDKDGRLDGHCVINRYLDGKLTFIMDTVYNSGKLCSYKQAFSYTNHAGVNVWAISEREINNENDIWKTCTYYKLREYEKNLTLESITEKDILSVDNLVKTESLVLEGYYSGNISDGYYNDNTGEAHLVKYDEKGKVRYLYVGKVVDGYPYDETGNAWCISLGYDNEHYYYYKGTFENEEDTNEKLERKTLDEINSIIAPYNFKCELKWVGEDNI